ncbi:MAG: hypothetical protein U1E19_10470 [Rhodoblastus sp.]
MRRLCVLPCFIGLFAASPVFAAGLNPPEVKDAAPEARGNIHEDKKDGVITPPAQVDPNMKTQPPHDGSVRTPVIPPLTEKDGRKIEPK